MKACAKSLCQLQISALYTVFGLPKRRTKRSIHSVASDTMVPEGVATAKATDSGPLSAAIAPIFSAISSIASSQETGTQPGSGSDLGLVRRSGVVSRLVLCAISGAERPLGHIAVPVGWSGSGRTPVSRPSSMVKIAPQRDLQRVQNPRFSSDTTSSRLADLPPVDSPGYGTDQRRWSRTEHRRTRPAGTFAPGRTGRPRCSRELQG